MAAPLQPTRAPRVELSGAAIVYLGNRQLTCIGGNISTSGMLVYPPERARPGQFVRVIFAIGDQWIDADAVLVREASENRRYGWGLTFIQIASHHRAELQQFIGDRLGRAPAAPGSSSSPAAAPRPGTGTRTARAVGPAPRTSTGTARAVAGSSRPSTGSFTARAVADAPRPNTGTARTVGPTPSRPLPTVAARPRRGGAASETAGRQPAAAETFELRDVTPIDEVEQRQREHTGAFRDENTPVKELYQSALRQLADEDEDEDKPRGRRRPT